MNSDFEIKGTVKDDEIYSIQNKSKYDPIIKACNTLKTGEILKVKIKKIGQVSAIDNRIKKSFKHTRFKVMQRNRGREFYCFIQRL